MPDPLEPGRRELRKESATVTEPTTNVCFVIPTYNEAPNVTPLLRRLTELYPDPHTTFLVVDDESPDGTGRLVREFAATDGRVHLLEGKRRGFGQAYVRGMRHALHALAADVVVQMDADFSHDPADAGRLVARIRDGADVAIGSRYVTGGALDERWPTRRRVLSRWGNRLARWVAGVRGVRDCTAGFKAIRASALGVAKVEDIAARNHAFQVVLLYRLLRSGAQVVEEPIYFHERERGEAKLDAGNVLELFWNLWRLRLAEHRTFFKFALTGLSGVLVNLGSFHLLLELGLHKFLASPVAIELSIVWNFLLHNYWTFADRVMHGRKRIRGLRYNLVSLLTLSLSYATFVGLSVLFTEAPPVLLQGCGIVPAIFLNYTVNSAWTFRGTDHAG